MGIFGLFKNTERVPVVPIGGMIDYAGVGDPADPEFKLADGRAMERAAWPALYAVIGDRYTREATIAGWFRLPDCRGSGTIGPDNMGTARGAAGRNSGVNDLGARGGAATVLLTAAQSGVQDHHHHMESADFGVGSVAPPPQLWNSGGKLYVRGDAVGGGGGIGVMMRTDGAFSFGIGVGGIFGGARNATAAHSVMQPYQVVNKIIRVI